MAPPPSVAVIGAGPSGLVACKSLAAHGLRFTAYEAGDRVGGQWVLGNSSGTSSAYRSLHANTHKGMCRYADYPLPDDYPDFPSHAQMAAWFDAYARDFDLYPHIRLGARVASARRAEVGGWQVELAGGERAHHDALVVATGNLWDPRAPDLPGTFDGETLHAKHYLDPTDPVDCRGRTVAVMGLGNTACELAVELSKEGGARRVLLSARSGQNFVPKIAAPVPHPSEPLTGPLAWLPRSLRDAAFRALFPRIVGRMLGSRPTPQSLGLPPPPADPFEKRFVIDNGIFDRLAAGSIEPRPGVRRLCGREIEFADGSRDEVDVLITATGYRFSLPFLSDELLGARPEQLRLFRGVMHPRHHDLFIVGVMKAICSIWPRSEQQMAFVAPLLAGEYALPGRREIDRESYAPLQVPFGNCQFHTHDLHRELARGRRRASRRRVG
ncbi:MAG: flavin-containing monooxygenase [Myxococcota bacterium]